MRFLLSLILLASLSAKSLTTVPLTVTLGYGYDLVGNRTNRTGSLGSLGAQTLGYTTNDWLTNDVYDFNGSTTASGGSNYLYDVERRLTNVNNGAIVMVYNGDGVRVSKTVNGVTTTYLVVDRNPTGYAQVLDEVSDDGTERRYTIGNDLISQTRSDGSSFITHFYGYDGHGSVRFLTDENGAITDTYTYDVYGVLIGSTGNTPNNYLYAGEQFDFDLGFIYLRAPRYLNPGTGRFTTSDSFEGNQSDPLSLHKYLYCYANPVNSIDPSGEFTLMDVQITGSIQAYLAATLVSYSVGKATSATYLKLSDGNLNRFQWFEASDLLALVPGAFLANVVKLPVQMVTKVGGLVVGKAFASGGVQRVANGFSQWFASTGGKLVMRSANGAVIELEKGTTKRGFQHLLERHLAGFWNGSKSDITTFWPSDVSPSQMLNLLKEAAGKYVVGGAAAQPIKLSNGIRATLVVHGGKVTTFFPEAGPGVIHAAELLNAVP